ncbi:MAG: FtsX-like permease family protein, partial [Bacteroidales bacterium]|nr:FtsX-like permease family protein [Bacteroidales bacterium]
HLLDEATPVESEPRWIPYASEISGVREIRPVVYRSGIIRSGENIQGVMFKGDAEYAPADTSLSLPVAIPSRLAGMLGLKVGDPMTTYFVGSKVKARKFTVDSIYDSVLDADDKIVVRCAIADLQRVNGWDGTKVSGFEVLADMKIAANPRALSRLSGEVGFAVNTHIDEDSETPVYASSLSDKYPQLFDWLDLLDFNVLFILILMTIVAGFNMISGLLIMLFENISTIGLLKALGMTDRSIAKVFLASSSSLVLKGMAIGNALALLFCLFEGMTHALKLDPANYFVPFVPVDVNIWMILAADIVAYLVIMVLLLIPSLFISKVDPAQTVRVE